MNTHITAVKFAALLILSTTVGAQTPSGAIPPQPETLPVHAKDVVRDVVREHDDADAGSGSPGITSKIVLATESDKTTATLRISDTFGLVNKIWSYEVKASGPVGKDDAPAEVGTLSGLGAGPNIGFGLTFIQTKLFASDNQTPIQAEALQKPVCNAYIAALKITPAPKCSSSMFEETYFNNVSAIQALQSRAAIGDEAAKGELAALKAYRRDMGRRFWEVVGGKQPIYLWGLRGSIGGKSFKFIEEVQPTNEKKETEKNYSVGFDWTRVSEMNAMALGYRHERTYSDNTSKQICTPIANTTSSSCVQRVVGAPKLTERNVAFIEYRWLASSKSWAISPKIEHDFEKSSWGIRVPIYAAISKDKGLTGGLAVGWDTEQHETGVTFFVSKAFSLTESD